MCLRLEPLTNSVLFILYAEGLDRSSRNPALMLVYDYFTLNANDIHHELIVITLC